MKSKKLAVIITAILLMVTLIGCASNLGGSKATTPPEEKEGTNIDKGTTVDEEETNEAIEHDKIAVEENEMVMGETGTEPEPTEPEPTEPEPTEPEPTEPEPTEPEPTEPEPTEPEPTEPEPTEPEPTEPEPTEPELTEPEHKYETPEIEI